MEKIIISSKLYKCPYCSLIKHDPNDKILKRTMRNMTRTTSIKCKRCGSRFGLNYDNNGNMVTFKVIQTRNPTKRVVV